MDPFRRAVQQLARLPGVGERTATRYAYWLLRQSPEVSTQLADAIVNLRTGIRECETCCDLSPLSPCLRCADGKRDPSLVCVVERPQDVGAIDAAGEFRGRFHVLHGALSPLDGIGPDQLRLRELVARAPDLREVILATDPDVEGDTTALYVAKLLAPLGVKVTRLAHGLAVGTAIEFADRASLARALQGRLPL
ncbi:MAG: recombination protein RecR [Deltaproteobacteria bacterium]|nr:recombination protein RecR [Deltaproteobacteria bacterium]